MEKLLVSKKPESKLQLKIRKALKKYFGGFWIKIHGGPFQQKGMPDLLGCVDGYYITVEVKLPNNKKSKLSPVQKIIMAIIRRAGGCSIVATSEQQAIDKIEEWLNERTRSAKKRPSERGQICLVKKKGRFIHGAENWQNSYSSSSPRMGLSKGEVNKSTRNITRQG